MGSVAPREMWLLTGEYSSLLPQRRGVKEGERKGKRDRESEGKKKREERVVETSTYI